MSVRRLRRRLFRPASPMLPRPACCLSDTPAHSAGRPSRRVVARWRSRLRPHWAHNDMGMTTAEYALGTLAACAFAALLYKVLTSGAVQGMLEAAIKHALTLAG